PGRTEAVAAEDTRRSAMRHSLLALAVLLLPVLVRAQPSPEPVDEKTAVRKLDVPGPMGRFGRGAWDRPAQVTSAAELDKALPDAATAAAVAKAAKFAEERVLVFSWGGSGGDRLSYSVAKEKGKLVAVFMRRAGRTDDLRRHFHVYAVKKG